MQYQTELMQQILTSEKAQKMIDYVTDCYGEAYYMLWFYQSIGRVLEEAQSIMNEIRLQAVPQTATWSIAYWEAEYGILPDQSWTLQQRIQNVINNMSYRAPINPEKMKNMISNIMGFDVEIHENTGKNKFIVSIGGYSENLKKAKKIIERAKPAHLIYEVMIADKNEVPIHQYNKINISEQETEAVVILS